MNLAALRSTFDPDDCGASGRMDPCQSSPRNRKRTNPLGSGLGSSILVSVSPFRVLGKDSHPGGNPGANLKSISRRCYLRDVAFELELT